MSAPASTPVRRADQARARRASAPPRPNRVPTRSCVACRTARPKRELVRVVRTPDGRLLLDTTGRVAGRGAYLCNDSACRRTAVTRGAISRALETSLPAELRSVLEAGPERLTGGEAIGQE